MATIAQLKAVLTLDSSRFRRGLDKASARLRAAGRKMKSAGQSMTTNISAPLAAIGGAGIKLAADLEESMGRIQGLVGLSRKQVQAFKDDFIRLSEKTGQSATDLSKAMFFITSNLFRGEEALNLLEVSAKGATAGLGNLKQLARATGAVMNAFGSDTLSAKEAMGSIIATFKKGSIQSLPGLINAFSRVGSIASETGFSLQDTAAAMAAMTLQGTKASTSGRQLRQVLNKLVDVTPKSRKAFKKFGISLENVQTLLGKGKLMKALQKIKDRVGGNIQSISDLIPRMRALTGVMQLAGKSMDKNRKIFETLRKETGQSLVKAFNVMVKTAKVKFFKVFQKIKNDLRALGEAITPAAIKAFKKFASVVERVSKFLKGLNEETQRQVFLATTVLGLSGPLLILIGQMAIGIAGLISVVSSLSSVLFSLSNAMVTAGAGAAFFTKALFKPAVTARLLRIRLAKLGGVLSSFGSSVVALGAPILAIVAILALLAETAIIVKQNWDKFRIFFIQMWKTVSNGVNKAFDFIAKKITKALNAIKKQLGPFARIVNKIWKGIAETAFQAFAEVAEQINQALSSVASALAWLAKKAGLDLGKTLDNLSKKFESNAQSWKRSAKKGVKGIIEDIKTSTDEISDLWSKGFKDLTKKTQKFLEKNNIEWAEFRKTVVKSNKDFFEDLKRQFKGFEIPLPGLADRKGMQPSMQRMRKAKSGKQRRAGKDPLGFAGGIRKAADAMAEMRKKMKDSQKGVKDWRKEIDAAESAAQSFGQSVVQSMSKMLKKLVQGKATLKDVGAQILQAGAKGIQSSITRSVSTGFGNFLAGGGFIQGFASGGRMRKGQLGLVGEKGPELFAPGQSGKIISNEDLKGVGGDVVKQNINVTTGVQQTVRAEIMSLMPRIKEAAASGVQDDTTRGGRRQDKIKGV